MITVYCVLWGDKYTPGDVWSLKRNVRNHYEGGRFRFVCITDQVVHGVECLAPLVDWPGWWQKVGLFAPDYVNGAPGLYLDLDCVIVGELREWSKQYTAPGMFAMPRNWARSGHGGWQSSVMAWGAGGLPRRVFDEFDYQRHSLEHYGDQEWITHLMGADGIAQMSGVCSYKYHCVGVGVPRGARVVAFHGQPKQRDVADSWVLAELA